jgi:hypothetical protein
MNTVTGNPMRDLMIAQAVNRARADDGVTTLPAIQILLPADFDLAEQELKDTLALMGSEPPEVTAESADAAPAEPTAPTMTREQAQERVRLAHADLAAHRADLIRCGNRQRKARADLGAAISAFIAQQAPKTREQLIRDEIAANQQFKADVAVGKVRPRERPRPGRSVVDRIASYQRGGSPASGNFRRGGMLHAEAARRGYMKQPPQPPAPKVGSAS